jgi:hypothetical protein
LKQKVLWAASSMLNLSTMYLRPLEVIRLCRAQ